MRDSVYVHPKAMVESEQIGEGSRIWAFSHVMKGVSIGKDCNIGEHCFLETGACVGNDVTIKNGNMIWEGITLEDGVFIGPGAIFSNDLYPRSPRLPQAHARYQGKGWLVPTLIQHGASIGAGSVLVAGVTVGSFAMVGAGTVVTKDVPPHALVIGTPARIIGWVCQCGHRLILEQVAARCSHCGTEYIKRDDLVAPKVSQQDAVVL
jgi:UDP-2-acetamido-3-amino-2,3-dideoxy-glucuronate N-acetyltransferase